FEHIQEAFSEISSRVQENVAGVRVVRAYAQEAEELAKFQRADAEYVRLNLRLAWLSGLFTPLLQFLVGLTSLVVLWLGGARVLQGTLTLGSYVMFNTYMAILVKPMVTIGRVMNIIQRGAASLQRIQVLVQERPTIAAPPDATVAAAPATGTASGVDRSHVAGTVPAGPAVDGVL